MKRVWPTLDCGTLDFVTSPLDSICSTICLLYFHMLILHVAVLLSKPV